MTTTEIKAGDKIKITRPGSKTGRTHEVIDIRHRDGFAFIDVPATKSAYATDGIIKTIVVVDGSDQIQAA